MNRKKSNPVDHKKFIAEDVLARILLRVEGADKMVWKFKGQFSQINQMVASHSDSIIKLETQIGKISTTLDARPKSGLPSNTVANLKNYAHIFEIVTQSGNELTSKRVLVKEKFHDNLGKK